MKKLRIKKKCYILQRNYLINPILKLSYKHEIGHFLFISNIISNGMFMYRILIIAIAYIFLTYFLEFYEESSITYSKIKVRCSSNIQKKNISKVLKTKGKKQLNLY